MVVLRIAIPQALSRQFGERLRVFEAGLPVDIQPWSQSWRGPVCAVATVSAWRLGGIGAMLAITGIFGWRLTRQQAAPGDGHSHLP